MAGPDRTGVRSHLNNLFTKYYCKGWKDDKAPCTSSGFQINSVKPVIVRASHTEQTLSSEPIASRGNARPKKLRIIFDTQSRYQFIHLVQVVRKPVNTNPGLKVNRSINVCCVKNLFPAYAFCGSRLRKLRTEGQIIERKNLTEKLQN